MSHFLLSTTGKTKALNTLVQSLKIFNNLYFGAVNGVRKAEKVKIPKI